MCDWRVKQPLLHRRPPGRIGCFVDGEATFGVHVGDGEARRPMLAAYSPALQPELPFGRWVGQTRLRGGRTNLVCSPAAYRLLLVAAPDVPPEELRGAMRWKIKDLIDFHVDDAVIDVFDLPGRDVRGAQHNLYVVAARRRAVQTVVDRADDVGLAIQAIDIPELCLRNVVACNDLDERGAVVLHLDPDAGTLVVTRGGTLHFTRRLDLGYADLADGANVSSAVLEIQRSLDYCDSHLDLGRPQTLFVTPAPEPLDHLLDAVRNEVGLEARTLRLSDVVEHDIDTGPEDESRLLIAAGAALRREERRL